MICPQCQKGNIRILGDNVCSCGCSRFICDCCLSVFVGSRTGFVSDGKVVKDPIVDLMINNVDQLKRLQKLVLDLPIV